MSETPTPQTPAADALKIVPPTPTAPAQAPQDSSAKPVAPASPRATDAQSAPKVPRTPSTGGNARHSSASEEPRKVSLTSGKEEGKATATVRSERRTVRISIPDGWARGLLTGIEAALLGWGLSTLMTIVGYWALVDNPWMANTTWSDAMMAGSTLWASGLGGIIYVASAVDSQDTALSFTAIPLLLTMLTIGAMRALLLSGRRFPPASHFFAIPGFMLMNSILIASNRAWMQWTPTLIGMFVLSLVATTWAYASDSRALGQPSVWARLFPRFAQAIERGLRIGVRLLGSVAALSTVALALIVTVRWPSIAGIAEVLQPQSSLDQTMLVIAQTLFVPNAVAWLLAWVSGAGLAIGVDAFHSIGAATVAPIPPIPLLGILPAEPYGYGWITLLVLLSLIAGVVWGSVVQHEESALSEVISAAVALVLFWGVSLAWLTASVLVLGSGRLAHVGPFAFSAAALLVCEIAVPLFAAYLATHPEVVRTTMGWTRRGVGTVAASSLGQTLNLSGGADESKESGGNNHEAETKEKQDHSLFSLGHGVAKSDPTVDRDAETSLIDTAQYVADPEDSTDSSRLATHDKDNRD